MPNKKRKLIAIFVTLLFLTSSVVISSATEIKQSVEKNKDVTEEPVQLSKITTLYRHGIDGSVKPINVKINFFDNEDFGDAIAEKCQELFENDEEFNDLENISKIKLGVYNIIKSKGRGFHYQMALLGKLSIRYILFRLGLPRINTIFIKPIIICKYKNDKKAKTTITSLILGGKTKEVNGSHIVIAHNFIGFTSWIGRFSFTPLNIVRKSFYGIARFSICVG